MRRSKIVDRIVKLIAFLSKFTVYSFVVRRFRYLADRGNRTRLDRIVESYVLSWAFAAFFVYVYSFIPIPTPGALAAVFAIVVISSARIMEIVLFHLRRVLVGAGRDGGVETVASYSRLFMLMLVNYLEITLWFGSWYSFAQREGLLIVGSPKSLFIFRESLSMMVANSTGLVKLNEMAAQTDYFFNFALWAGFCAHTLVGLFMTLVVLTQVISFIPAPKEEL
jgi:hypothetical protein